MKRAKADDERDAGGARSPHAYMRAALGAKALLIEQRLALLRAALAAEDEALQSGRGYRSIDVDAYFEARAAEREVGLPALHAWRK